MRHSGGVSERLRIAILCGGWSSEREASLQNGTVIADAIVKKYEVVTIDPIRDLTRFAAQIISARPDVILNVLSGDDSHIIAAALKLTDIPNTAIEKGIAIEGQIVTLIENTLSQSQGNAA
jgi:D-alanine-D-alanine ligase-like ATP-grasp enzyme